MPVRGGGAAYHPNGQRFIGFANIGIDCCDPLRARGFKIGISVAGIRLHKLLNTPCGLSGQRVQIIYKSVNQWCFHAQYLLPCRLSMPVYLPIAEMSVNAFEIIFLGVAVGIFSGLFGVGGGFLALPFLVFVGIPPTVAVTTQSAQILASSTAGVISQWKRGRVDVSLAIHMMAGGAGGLLVGLGIFQLLKFMGQIDFAISLIYTVLLASIGLSMFAETAHNHLFKKPKAAAESGRFTQWLESLPYQTIYAASGIRVSLLAPVAIGFVAGLLISILGSGGGFVIVPAMIYFLGMPALMVTGTSLLQLMVIAAFSCVMYSITSHSVDLMLAALLILGSVTGTILGLRATKYIKGVAAHLLLASVLVFIALRLGYTLLATPAEPFSLTVDP